MGKPSLPYRFGLPFGLQLGAILICVLIAAQMVTLALTVVFPPAPTARWNLDEVAQALSGGPLPPRLERRAMRGPPAIDAPGWLVSETSRETLARRLDRPAQDVVLAFYTQLPVGGVAVPAGKRAEPLAAVLPAPHGGYDGKHPAWTWFIDTAHAQAVPGGPPPGGSGMPGSGFPGGLPGGFPGGRFPGGAMPGGTMPGGAFPGGVGPRGGAIPGGGPRAASPAAPLAAQRGTSREASPGAVRTAAFALQKPGGVSDPAYAPPLTPSPLTPGLAGSVPGMSLIAPSIVLPGEAPLADHAARPAGRTVKPAFPAPTFPSIARGTTAGTAAAPASLPAAAAPSEIAANATHIVPVHPGDRPQPIPFRRERQGFRAFVSPPFIEGDFVAAARQRDGSWLAVAPAPEAFPNRWQKRVLAWFFLSLGIVSPLAWMFARTIVRPLRGFADAAEALGRDPSAMVLLFEGSAEVGRAARAFNQMRHRLRAFVDDRTAMVGAISHDLRTPLTRLRFRLEDVPDELREGLLKEVTEMEAMISQVLAFIRDASTPGARQRLDFAELVAGSVRDACLIGGDIAFDGGARLPVEVDPVGIRRLLGNLLENAVKYGEHAQVRLSLGENEAIADIIDSGPGLPEEEWDRVFEPFYRGEAARRSDKPGNGLGLAVCRSIARAHGGDVTFARVPEGFVVRLALPLVPDGQIGRAA